MYEGMTLEDQELLQAFDSIINKAFAEQRNIDALAKRAIERFVYTGNQLFPQRLAQAATVCGIEEPVACMKYILCDSFTYNKKENEYKLRMPVKAKRLLHDFRQRSNCEFSDVASLVREEKEAVKAMKKTKTEEKTTLQDVREKISNYLKKLDKANSEDAEIKALISTLQEANKNFQLSTQEAEVVVDAE